MIQMTFCGVLAKQMKELLMWLRKTGNRLFVLWFLWMTADLLLDDMARSGSWLQFIGRDRKDLLVGSGMTKIKWYEAGNGGG